MQPEQTAAENQVAPKHDEVFAVVQTGSISDEGEIVQFGEPVVISYWPTREKANSMKKRQANKVTRLTSWFASHAPMFVPILAVRVAYVKARKPRVEDGANADGSKEPDLTLPPVEEETVAERVARNNRYTPPAGKSKRK